MAALIFIFVFAGERKKLLFPVTITASFGWAVALLLFIKGKGYGMLKIFDYHVFLPILIWALALDLFLKLDFEMRDGLKKLLYGALVILVVGFSIFALHEKRLALSNYRKNIVEGNRLADYKIDVPQNLSVKRLRPLLTDFDIDLFYYVNRWLPVPMQVDTAKPYSGTSYRFLPQDRSASYPVSHLIRFDFGSGVDVDRPSNLAMERVHFVSAPKATVHFDSASIPGRPFQRAPLQWARRFNGSGLLWIVVRRPDTSANLMLTLEGTSTEVVISVGEGKPKTFQLAKGRVALKIPLGPLKLGTDIKVQLKSDMASLDITEAFVE